MTNEQATYRRVLRRETHASRTASSMGVASIGAVLLIALLAGAVWWLVDGGFRDTAARRLEEIAVGVQQPAVLFGVGGVLTVLAVVLLALALLPGRRARRARITERTALLVDDGVIADSIAAAVARRAGVDRSRVSVFVGRRTVEVRITPTSGVFVRMADAEDAASDILAGIGFSATPRVVVEPNGVVA
ncbi:hypothetical protein HCX50_14670 [Microbacterium oxydans]|uniref:hypothetical protein n=1 Tax=Microbacterium sp. B19(2022) TaxID=2914045 RepID=UPI0014315982|nr:hypothetical protein [Microbacterium sp. B19(2022)]NJI60673.1 hypothetical protein [Microbacterium sp. B19(2022)]